MRYASMFYVIKGQKLKKWGDPSSCWSKTSVYVKNQVSSSGIGKFGFLELSNEVKNVHFKSKCKKPLYMVVIIFQWLVPTTFYSGIWGFCVHQCRGARALPGLALKCFDFGDHNFWIYACMQKIRLTASKLTNLPNEALKCDILSPFNVQKRQKLKNWWDQSSCWSKTSLHTKNQVSI